MKYLKQLKLNQLKNKTCLLRVDLNIKSPEKDAFRLRAVLPTIKFLIKNKAKIIILSHRGRPSKALSIKHQASSYTLKPFAKIISLLLRKPVHFMDFKKGFNASEISDTITRDSILLLENLRFFPEEEKNNRQFAKKLASLGDIFINDAFAVSHRENASVAAITQFLPSYAGLLLEKEIGNLDAVMKKSKKPLVVVLGGAKVSDKIGLINNFFKKAD